MAEDFLEQILSYKRNLLEEKKDFFASLKVKVEASPLSPPSFQQAIARDEGIQLIAELKKASPSQGVIREDFDLLRLAQIYCEHRAAAISVLTEDQFFLGQPEFIKTVSEHIKTPILTKDFIIDQGQIYEATLNGASAVLLIVAILEDTQLKSLIQAASEINLDCLVEVHDESELDRALQAGAGIIGINHRDLHTFDVDLTVSERMIPLIPRDKIIVVESGIHSHAEVRRFEAFGAHAVLIGETFMRAKDVGGKVEEVMKGK